MARLKDTADSGETAPEPARFIPPAGQGEHGVPGGDIQVREDRAILAPRVQTKRPPFFKVIMLNDDYTPMDFVVEILKSVFRKDHREAVETMLEIHRQGAAACGVFTRDVAETKIDMVVACARQHEYPLQCTMEIA